MMIPEGWTADRKSLSPWISCRKPVQPSHLGETTRNCAPLSDQPREIHSLARLSDFGDLGIAFGLLVSGVSVTPDGPRRPIRVPGQL
jgi:hypothetical protein